MDRFEKVTEDAYNAAVARGPSSERFKQLYAEVRGDPYDGWNGPSFLVHNGDLHVAGNWRAPGFHTLVRGSLLVDGLVDLGNWSEEGFDEYGEFVVLGDLCCEAFSGHYGKISYIDGRLEARQVVNNDFDYSSLRILGDLRTPLYYAPNNPAEVGGQIIVERVVGRLRPLRANMEPDLVDHTHSGETGPLDGVLIDTLDIHDPDFSRAMTAVIREGGRIFRSL